MPQTHPEKLFAEVWQASPDELGAVTVKGSLSMTTPCLLGAIVQADSIMISCSKLLRAYVEDFNSDVVFIARNADLPVKYLTHVLNLVCQHRPGLTWRIGLVTIYLSDMADIGMFAMLHLYFL